MRRRHDVDRTRVRSVKVVIEMDEPDGSITTYEANGRFQSAGNHMHLTPEYGPGGVPTSVGVSFEALLLPFDPADREYADFPLFRIETIPPEQVALPASAATDNVLMIIEGPTA